MLLVAKSAIRQEQGFPNYTVIFSSQLFLHLQKPLSYKYRASALCVLQRDTDPLHLSVFVYWRCSVKLIKYTQQRWLPARAKEGADFPLDYKWLLNPRETLDLSVLCWDTQTHSLLQCSWHRILSDLIKRAVGAVLCFVKQQIHV
jgi:hypothetical protein